VKISELFFSIQGEGKRSGLPSFFIRTNHCNLRCRFSGGNLCDTAYTSWFPDDKNNLGEADISEVIGDYKKYFSKDIVITGGEPAMYGDEIEKLCMGLKQLNPECFITLETNGTYSGDFLKLIDLISISPKLKSSVPFETEFEKMHERNRINVNALMEICRLSENKICDVQWKFVFTGDDDINEISKLQKTIGFKNEDVYLMPEGITKKEIDSKRLRVIEVCLKNNFNFTDRLHILAWGNKRGI